LVSDAAAKPRASVAAFALKGPNPEIAPTTQTTTRMGSSTVAIRGARVLRPVPTVVWEALTAPAGCRALAAWLALEVQMAEVAQAVTAALAAWAQAALAALAEWEALGAWVALEAWVALVAWVALAESEARVAWVVRVAMSACR